MPGKVERIEQAADIDPVVAGKIAVLAVVAVENNFAAVRFDPCLPERAAPAVAADNCKYRPAQAELRIQCKIPLIHSSSNYIDLCFVHYIIIM